MEKRKGGRIHYSPSLVGCKTVFLGPVSQALNYKEFGGPWVGNTAEKTHCISLVAQISGEKGIRQEINRCNKRSPACGQGRVKMALYGP